MSTPLLTTKLYIPPAPPRRVARPRLVARLDEAMARKLTLLSAPAGFGKTTLLGEWINTLTPVPPLIPSAPLRGPSAPFGEGVRARVAWLSLDESDNDPARFLSYLIAALQTVRADVGQVTRGLLQTPQAPLLESTLTVLIDEIAAVPTSFALVLDDFHVIDAQRIHTAIAFLLDHLPPPMHLVISSRADPPLPLARLRAQGQMLELRASDLRFTSEEAAAFLNQVMRLDLSAEQTGALEARTEGWIAGLQLASLSMQGRKDVQSFIAAFSGSHRYVLDYLTEEVLRRQPDQRQQFLLRTSILDSLCGPLCEAVTEMQDGAAILEALEHANLFMIPLDDERRWYRYHHLFADVLRARLRHTHPDLVPELHRRASAWYEANGEIPAALHHALAGEYFEVAARIVERVGSSMLATGGWGLLLVWLRALPQELVQRRPPLALFYACALVLTGQLEDVERRLGDIERVLGKGDAGEAGMVANWRGQVAALRSRAAYLRGDFSRAIQQSREALELVPAEDLTTRGILAITLGSSLILAGQLAEASRVLEDARRVNLAAGNLMFATDAAGSLAQVQEAQGHLHRAAGTYREILRLAGDRIDPNVVAAHLNLGSVLYEWYDLEGANQHLQTALTRAQQIYMPDGMLFALIWLAKVKLAQGDREGSSTLMRRAEQEIRNFPPSIVSRHAAAIVAQLALARGDLESVARWAAGLELPPDDTLAMNFFLRRAEYLTQARLLIAQNRHVAAEQFLDKLHTAAESTGLTGCEVEILALIALARESQGDASGARDALTQALQRAEPEGYVGTFVEMGEPMRLVISDWRFKTEKGTGAARAQEVDPLLAYINKLLASFPGNVSHLSAKSKILPEPLSARELEVLRLLAAGRSNRQIAKELVLATGTVKKHLSNIFGKLNAQNRTECVARARELGLLQE